QPLSGAGSVERASTGTAPSDGCAVSRAGAAEEALPTKKAPITRPIRSAPAPTRDESGTATCSASRPGGGRSDDERSLDDGSGGRGSVSASATAGGSGVAAGTSGLGR